MIKRIKKDDYYSFRCGPLIFRHWKEGYNKGFNIVFFNISFRHFAEDNYNRLIINVSHDRLIRLLGFNQKIIEF